ncbi:MAG: tRNA (adenosine(37)-N6)-dimethylallyltransferase MiaA [Hyphomicrobiales bacterium]|nr:tRNA (adenosine(37)-N6)-dimethylallyltransferase MiaA [Hyphomicrobiales bacterium]
MDDRRRRSGAAGAPAALLIAGPTASGKSALAVEVARRVGGVVINADSMQVYRDLRVLTARPTQAEEAAAPHVLFGHVDAATTHSAGLWLAEAAAEIARARATGRVPVVVGGTGLHFLALVRGLSAIPAVPADVRTATRERFAGAHAETMHAALAAVDPATAARLRPTDPQRILRALEVHAATGRSLASFQGARAAPTLGEGEWSGLFLAPDRERLRAIIEARFDAMVAGGALEEAALMAARELDPALPAMRAHGLPALIEHVTGRLTLEEAVARGKADTRAYVKRQFTFARNQLPEFAFAEPGEGALAAACARIDRDRFSRA